MTESPLFTGRAGFSAHRVGVMNIGRERAAIDAMAAIVAAGGNPLPVHRLPNGLGYIAPNTGVVHGPEEDERTWWMREIGVF